MNTDARPVAGHWRRCSFSGNAVGMVREHQADLSHHAQPRKDRAMTSQNPTATGAANSPTTDPTNELFDVVALLASIEDRMQSLHDADKKQAAHHTLRLAQMARERVESAIKALAA